MNSPSEQQVVRTRHKATRSVERLLDELNAEKWPGDQCITTKSQKVQHNPATVELLGIM